MYNLNQSYSGGFLNYMDMKSINLAGASSKQLKQTLIDAAVALGKIKEGEVTIDNFDSTLKKKWADREVMERGFGDFAKLTTEVYKSYDAVRGVYTIDDKEYTTASEAIAALGTRYGELGYKALKSAQECKTFKEVVDATADAVSTQWLRIWKSIFGNYDEARELWTGLANGIYDTFVMPLINFRQRIESIMAFNPFQSIVDTINNSTIGEVAETVKNVTNSLEYYQEMKDKIWNGDYKNQPYRKPLLEEEGHNYEVLQSLVNKGYEYKLTMEDCIEAEEKFGIQIDRSSDNMEEVTQQLQKLSDQKLKDAGLTDAQIKQYHELEEIAKSLGKTVTEVTGRDLFIGSFRNIGEAISDIIKSITHAWHNVFHPDGKENEELNNAFSILQRIYKITELIRDRVKRLTEDIDGDSEGEKKISKLTRTLQGLFAILHLITSFIGAGFRLAFKVLEGVLSAFNISILDFTAIIGDAIYNFDRWVRENNIIAETVKKITEWIIKAAKATKEWVDHNEKIQAVLSRVRQYFSDFVKGIKDWVSGLKEADNIPKYIFEGLVNGIKSFGGIAYNALSAFIIGLIELVKNLLGIHSPSLVFMAIGAMIMAGLWIGLKDGASPILEFFRSFWNSIIDIAKNMNIGNILAITLSVGFLYVFNKIVKTISNAVGAISSLTSAFKSIGDAIKNLSKALILRGVAEIIKGVGIALLALAGALYIISKIDANKVWQSVGVLASIAGILVILAGGLILLSKFTKTASVLDLGKTLGLLMAMVAAIYLMVSALKKLGKMDNFEEAFDRLKRVLIAMGSFVVSLIAVTGIAKVADTGLDALSKFLIKLSLSLLLIVAFMKLAGKLKAGDIIKGTIVMGLMALYLKAVNKMIEATSKSAYSTKSFTSFGKMALELGLALTLFAVALKIAGKLKAGDIIKGTILLSLITGFIYALIAITKKSKIEATKIKEIHKIGLMVLELSASMLIIATAMKIMGMLTTSDIVKGTIVMIAFGALVAALVAVINITGRLGKGITSNVDFKKIATFMTSLSMSLLILSGAIAILGMLKTEQLVKGVTAVGILMLSIAGMMRLIGNLNMSFADAATIAILGTVITVISAMVIAFANQDPGRLLLGASVMTIILGVLGGILLALSKIKFTGSGTDAKTSIKKVAILAAELLILAIPLAAFVGILNLMNNVDNSIGKATALVELLGAAALIVAGLQKLSKYSLKTNTNLWKNFTKIFTLVAEMCLVGGPMYIFAQVLGSMPDINNPVAKATALSELLIAAGLIVGGLQALSKFAGKDTKSAAISSLFTLLSELLLAGLAGIAQAFAGVLSSMNNVKNPMQNAKALVYLITAMAWILSALAIVGGVLAATEVGILAAVVGGGVLELLFAGLAGLSQAFAGVLNSMSDTHNAKQNAEALVILITALTLIMGALAGIGTVAVLSVVGIVGFLAALGGLKLLLLEMGDVIDLLKKLNDIPDSANKIKSFTKLIESIAKVCAILASVGGRLLVADVAISGLIKILESFGLVATAVGFVTDKIPDLKDFADHGIEVFKILASGLGEILGSLFAGLSSDLPEIGTNLSDFMTNAKTFIDEIKDFDDSAQRGARSLVDVLKELIKENIWEKLTSWLAGGESFARLGTELTNFAKNMKGFMDAMKDMGASQGAVNAAKILVDCISTLTKSNFINGLSNIKLPAGGLSGIISAITGNDDSRIEIGQSLSEFADQFGDLGEGLKKFADKLKGFNKSDVEKFSAAADAVSALVDAAKKVNEINDGAVGRALGKEFFNAEYENLGSFGEKMADAGVGLAAFASAINGRFSQEDAERVKIAAESIKAMAEAANAVTSITTVAVKIGSLGDVLDEFSKDGRFIDKAANAFKKINTVESTVTTTVPIQEFIYNMITLADHLHIFLDHLGNLDDSKIDKIQLMNTALGHIKDIAVAASGDDLGDKLKKAGKAFAKFPQYMKDFSMAINGGTIQEFYQDMSGSNWVEGGKTAVNNIEVEALNIEKFKSALGVFQTIAESVNSIQIEDTTKLDNLSSAMEKLGSDSVKNFLKDFGSGDVDLSKFNDNMTNMKDGLDTLVSSIGTIDDTTANKMETCKSVLEILGQISGSDSDSALGKISNSASSTVDLKTYGENLKNFVDQLKKFVDGVIEVDSNGNVTKAKTAFDNILKITEGITKEKIENISNLSGALQSAAVQMLQGFVNSMSGESGLTSIDSIATAWANRLQTALSSDANIGYVWNGAKEMLTKALSPLSSDNEILSSSESIGKYVASGYINGMSSKSSDVYQAAYNLAKRAMVGLQDGSAVESPSKIAFSIGRFIDIGLMNGMNSLADDVYDASYGVADQAMIGLTRSISNISAIIENDMDTTPTIRPVLDLSDVEAGVGTLNSMMDNTTGILRAPTIGVFNNLGSISDTMNSRRQNGGEVVDAIDRLGKNLDNTSGDTYNINGIRVDSDEQITEAVSTLVRAARIDRRS